jgi:hypothetical protein
VAWRTTSLFYSLYADNYVDIFEPRVKILLPSNLTSGSFLDSNRTNFILIVTEPVYGFSVSSLNLVNCIVESFANTHQQTYELICQSDTNAEVQVTNVTVPAFSFYDQAGLLNQDSVTTTQMHGKPPTRVVFC